MTNQELIELLKKYDADAEVIIKVFDEHSNAYEFTVDGIAEDTRNHALLLLSDQEIEDERAIRTRRLSGRLY